MTPTTMIPTPAKPPVLVPVRLEIEHTAVADSSGPAAGAALLATIGGRRR